MSPAWKSGWRAGVVLRGSLDQGAQTLALNIPNFPDGHKALGFAGAAKQMMRVGQRGTVNESKVDTVRLGCDQTDRSLDAAAKTGPVAGQAVHKTVSDVSGAI